MLTISSISSEHGISGWYMGQVDGGIVGGLRAVNIVCSSVLCSKQAGAWLKNIVKTCRRSLKATKNTVFCRRFIDSHKVITVKSYRIRYVNAQGECSC